MCKRINYIVGVIIFRQPRRTKHFFNFFLVIICGENSNLHQIFHSVVVNLPFDPLKNFK